MYNVCFPLMQLFTVNPRHQGFRTTMIEEFITKLLDILRGTSDRSRPQDAGKHACREKIITIGGLVRSLELPAAIFMLVDYWEQNALHFHRAVRSPSVYGSFEEPHLRHEMAVLVARDTLWYAAARAEPAFFTIYSSFVKVCSNYRRYI